MPQNLRVDTFPDPVGHFGCCVAGGERVAPAPLGWYFPHFHFYFQMLHNSKQTYSFALWAWGVTNVLMEELNFFDGEGGGLNLEEGNYPFDCSPHRAPPY